MDYPTRHLRPGPPERAGKRGRGGAQPGRIRLPPARADRPAPAAGRDGSRARGALGARGAGVGRDRPPRTRARVPEGVRRDLGHDRAPRAPAPRPDRPGARRRAPAAAAWTPPGPLRARTRRVEQGLARSLPPADASADDGRSAQPGARGDGDRVRVPPADPRWSRLRGRRLRRAAPRDRRACGCPAASPGISDAIAAASSRPRRISSRCAADRSPAARRAGCWGCSRDWSDASCRRGYNGNDGHVSRSNANPSGRNSPVRCPGVCARPPSLGDDAHRFDETVDLVGRIVDPDARPHRSRHESTVALVDARLQAPLVVALTRSRCLISGCAQKQPARTAMPNSYDRIAATSWWWRSADGEGDHAEAMLEILRIVASREW